MIKTTEQFVAEARLRHGDSYSYEKTSYKSSIEKISITCKKCGQGFSTWPGHHLAGQGCSTCWVYTRGGLRKKKTTESFVAEAKAIHGEKFDYSKVAYVGSQKEVIIKCNDCGTEFQQIPNNHVRGVGCKACSLKESGAKRLNAKAEKFVERVKAVHADAYDYSLFEYKGSKTPSTLICKACGHKFQQTPDAHYAGKGCTPCATNRRAALRTKTKEQFVAEAEAIYGPGVFDYSETEYVYASDNVKIRCCACDFVFSRTPASHLQKHDCPKCCERRQVSKAETEWLDSLGVKDRQYRVKLPGRKTMIVDGYDQATNTVYAFLGSFWHGDPRVVDHEEVHPIIGLCNKEIYESTMKQIEDMKANGYSVVYVWEYDCRNSV
jgi:hypothetical protein